MRLAYVNILLTFFVLDQVCAHPTSFVLVKNEEQSPSIESHRERREEPRGGGNSQLELSRFHIISHINSRYSRTQMVSYVKNKDHSNQEYVYSFKIPVSAFISDFVMKIGEKEYRAEVKEKDVADDIYNRAVDENKGAGLVSQSEAGSEWIKYSVTSNIQAGNKVEFTVVYEYLLERNVGKCTGQVTDVYEHKINVDTKGKIVPDMMMVIDINENLPIDRSKLNLPELRKSDDDDNVSDSGDDDNIFKPRTAVDIDSNNEPTISYDSDLTKATITFRPNDETQKSMRSAGASVDLVVQYDVERTEDNDLQVVDGYFVHFLAPEQLQPLPKVAIFVLDISGSMVKGDYSCTDKLKQVKDAMFILLEDNSWTDNDFFNIVTFSDNAETWKSDPIRATESNRQEAITFINGVDGDGQTNLNEAIIAGLNQAERHLSKSYSNSETPIVFFMTDGEATAGVTDEETIRSNLKIINGNLKANIYGLAFGTLCPGKTSANYEFVQKISEDHDSFSRRIYDKADAALQIECFLSEISTILVKNLKVTYFGPIEAKQSLQSKTFLKGSEQIVVGKLSEGVVGGSVEVTIEGEQSDGRGGTEEYYDEKFYPILSQTVTSLSFLPRMFAYLTINKLIKNNDQESRRKAIELAKENNFVTSLTSLVVTSPIIDVVSRPNEDFATKAPQVQVFARPQPRLACPCRGSLTLYSSTYGRGEEWEISDQIANVDFDRFDNKMVSVKVVGNCQWEVYTEKGLYGESKRFSKGYYGSLQDMGVLFREGSSAMRIDSC